MPAHDDRFTLKDWLKQLLRHFTHNWAIKLLALVLAVFVWSVLVAQDPSLTREKTFSDVSVNITGQETMKRNGFIVVSDINNDIPQVTVKSDVPQLQYQAAAASNYNIRLDLSRIQGTGTQTLNILSSASSLYGTVNTITPASVDVEVQEYVTRYRIPVNLTVVGTLPESFHSSTPTLDPPMIAISGPRSQVDAVASAQVVLDQSALAGKEGSSRSALPFKLIGRNGYEMDIGLMEVTSESVLLDSVICEQVLYSTKEVQLDTQVLLSGDLAPGYEIKSVSASPNTITVAGYAANLELRQSLFTDNTVDISERKNSFNSTLRIRKPSELAWISTDTVTVSVQVGPVIKSQSFTNQRLTVTGLGDGLSVSVSNTNVRVDISGPQLTVDAIKSKDLAVHVDVSGLQPGVYEIAPTCEITGDNGSLSVDTIPETVTVTIRKR